MKDHRKFIKFAVSHWDKFHEKTVTWLKSNKRQKDSLSIEQLVKMIKISDEITKESGIFEESMKRFLRLVALHDDLLMLADKDAILKIPEFGKKQDKDVLGCAMPKNRIKDIV